MQDFDQDPLEVQQSIPSPQKNKGMLPSRPSFATCMNVFVEVQTAHRSLGSSSTSYRGRIPRFHTLGYVQVMEAKLDEHKRIVIMFQQAIEYIVHMTNILLKLFDMEIKKQANYKGEGLFQSL